ncbi:cytochrome c peroxidase [Gloeobacter morelensis]|uniref:Cytochrome c domain-containing protein n=1 Tax=Gloeobacter morelensis MG652769 TaxID=2781736 RepID=A0ABY3PQZ3_9CYAN|nr:cytochrome c peroxidase [Gloeobacter morelensis]UFP95958.1 hypothetical protein ISF26_06995 [Gloeobacter morelensis MG652769]
MTRLNSHALRLVGLAALLATAGIFAKAMDIGAQPPSPARQIAEAEEAEPPEVLVGERLFEETRFAQFYFANSGGDANAEPLPGGGDPVVATLITPDGPIAGPFAGKSMSCRQCHLESQAAQTPGGGFRTYADFAVRSPVPDRGDGEQLTVRNSPSLVNLALNTTAPAELYHLDGQFPNLEKLVADTLTDRNFGWKLTERPAAIRHVASIVRNDNGQGELAQQNGGAYALVLAGKSPDPRFVLPESYRLDVAKATDEQILYAVGRLMAAYMDSLFFARDEAGAFAGSPYDVFLQKNGLPRQPASGESDLAYSRRLRRLLADLKQPRFVTPADGAFELSDQPFAFGAQELVGLQIFLAEPQGRAVDATELQQGKVGNCMVCHVAPKFTDFSLHNTGASQQEYDAAHGEGAFANLPIPALKARNANYDAYLPPTSLHPNASGVFRKPADPANPALADLGAWNVYLNPDFKVPPEKLEALMGLAKVPNSGKDAALTQSLARFKTPGLRDLADSAPYLHNGSKGTLEAVAEFYRSFSQKTRAAQVRNADPEIGRIALVQDDVAALAAFMRSLKEDYGLD